MTTKSIKGFIGRVLDKLTGGDEAKITRFQTKAVKFLNNQISIRLNEVDDLKEKINDLEEKFEETLIDVNLDAIKTTEGLETYIPAYITKLNAVKKEISRVEDEIDTKEDEVADFSDFVDALKA